MNLTNFQAKIEAWMLKCFTPQIVQDKIERGDRACEEFFELLQSVDYPRERIGAIEEYSYTRPKGEAQQELGGVLVTLAALCKPFGLDLAWSAKAEYDRISTPGMIDKIRAKQAAKPTGDALPVAQVARSVFPSAPQGWEMEIFYAWGKNDFSIRLRKDSDHFVQGKGSTPQQAWNDAYHRALVVDATIAEKRSR